MKVILHKTTCTVIKEDGDPHFSGVRNAAGESRLLYHLKNILNSHGFSFIKKRMWRDGHLVDDMKQYLRVKKEKTNGIFCIHNPMWCVQGADYYLNEYGEVRLQIEWGDDTPQETIDQFHIEIQHDYKFAGTKKSNSISV